MQEEKKANIASYNSNPRFFEEKFQKNHEKWLPLLERFVSSLSGKKVLDMGCGPGIYLELFREKGLDALGIDLSDAFLERCAEKGLNVRKMDMENPLLYPFSFDGIWALASILHVPRSRVPALVKTWAKLLRPQGILFVSVKKGVDEGFVQAETGDHSKRWFTFFTEDEIRKLFSTHFDEIDFTYLEGENGVVWINFLFKLKSSAVKKPFSNL